MYVPNIGELVAKGESSTMRASVVIKALNDDEQIVYGEVYAPFVLDSHGEMMLPEDLKLLAHRFIAQKKVNFVDVQHDNHWIEAVVVESFIARAHDPDYTEAAWVLGTKVPDAEVWARIKRGEINGYSLEALVYKEEADVEYEYLPMHIGLTEENSGHFHAFFVEVDSNGKVTKGHTGPADDGHTHNILAGTATEIGNDHAHRYFLNEIDDED